jgi:hypothetical protein
MLLGGGAMCVLVAYNLCIVFLKMKVHILLSRFLLLVELSLEPTNRKLTRPPRFRDTSPKQAIDRFTSLPVPRSRCCYTFSTLRENVQRIKAADSRTLLAFISK